MTENGRERAMIRPFVITGGRAYATRTTLDVATVVVAARTVLTGLAPEKRRVVELCSRGALGIVEIAAHLRLPTSVTKVLVSDLVDSGHVRCSAPVAVNSRPDLELLEKVLDGLRALA